MAVRSSNVDVRLRLRGQRQFSREVRQAGEDLEKMGLRGANALSRFAQRRDRLKAFGSNWTKKVTLPIIAGAGLATKAMIDWEDAFAGVEKTVDASPRGYARLEEQLRSLSMRIPVAATELAGIAESAGQLGIANKNLIPFTRTMANLAVATNLTSEQAATQLARFANIMKMPQTEFERLGSTVVALGNNFATTEAEIVSLGMRIAAAGSQVGLSESQVMSIAAALSSVGVAAEAGGTAISTTMLKINSAVLSGGAELEKFAEIAGMSSDQLASLWKRDAAAGLTAFIEGLARLRARGGDMATTLKDVGLGGIRVTDILGRASGNTKVLTDALGLGARAWRENSALTEEARKRYRTLKSQLQILKNIGMNFAVTIGRQLVPAIKQFAEFAGPKVKWLADQFGRLPAPVKAAAAGFLLTLAAIGPLVWMLGALAGGVGRLLMILNVATRAVVALNAVLLANPAVLIAAGVIALAAAFVLAYKKVDWFRDAVDAVFGWIKTAAGNVVGWLRSNWMIVVGVLTGPFGLAVAMIVKHWDKVKGAATAAFNWIRNAISNVVSWLRSHWPIVVGILTGPVGLAVAMVIKHWGKIKAAATSVVGWIKGKFESFIGFFASLPGRIADAAKGLFRGIKEAFRSAINWIIDKWNGLELKIGGQRVDLPDPLGSVSIPEIKLSTPDIPRLARGGEVVRSGLVEVGERGPEILQLPTAARVVPLDSRPLARPAGGQPIVVKVPVHLDGRVLAESTARVAEREASLGVAG